MLYNTSNATSPIAVIGEDWVLDCVANHKLVDESTYIHGKNSIVAPSIKTVPASNSTTTQSKNSRGSKRRRPSSEDKVSPCILRRQLTLKGYWRGRGRAFSQSDDRCLKKAKETFTLGYISPLPPTTYRDQWARLHCLQNPSKFSQKDVSQWIQIVKLLVTWTLGRTFSYRSLNSSLYRSFRARLWCDPQPNKYFKERIARNLTSIHYSIEQQILLHSGMIAPIFPLTSSYFEMTTGVRPRGSFRSSDLAQYYVWTHWGKELRPTFLLIYIGRVGETGQFNLDRHGSNVEAALAQFKQKFRQKAKLAFEDRHAEPKPGIFSYHPVNRARSLCLYRTIIWKWWRWRHSH